MKKLKHIVHETDFCVVGGGIAGMLAAIAAARRGIKVVLMHDRPVLGGNASSEIKMWVCGAGSRVKNLQETGIMEEIALENMYRNPTRNWSVWDAILYEKVKFEPNITLLLNCSCCDAEMNKNQISTVTGFQLTTYTWHKVNAKLFADCSGDSILAPLSGAKHRIGREAREEFDEEWGQDIPDSHTMGMSLLLQARETDHKVDYFPPAWAYKFPSDEAMRNKPHTMLQDLNTNFYWIELGGMADSIHDTEEIRDELLKIVFGCWDHMKNYGEHGADNWELEWVGFLPGKRESVRYVGDYMLTQNDIENGTAFDDEVAYGGWQIDNHLPEGFDMSGLNGAHLQKKRLTKPYGIPFRSLYSYNISNLMFAGRNISATHVGFCSTRVMGTCGIMGQAIGNAAVLAVKNNLLPRQIYEEKVATLQQMLMEDDCFLPHIKREVSKLTQNALLSADYGDPSAIINGIDRRIWGNDNGYYGKVDCPITISFSQKTKLSSFRLVVDSDLDREYIEGNPNLMNIPMPLFRAKSYNETSFGMPKTMIKSFKIEILDDNNEWQIVYSQNNNYMRFIRGPIEKETTAVRFVPLETFHSSSLINTYGSVQAHIFSFEVR